MPPFDNDLLWIRKIITTCDKYSEDIDLVQIKEGPIKPILKKIGEVIDFFEEDRVVKQKANNNTILYRFSSEYNPENRLRLKIEINCREHFNVFGWERVPFGMNSDWFCGEAVLTTYDPNELLATKLRAFYQRKKGRDLFDLHYSGQNLDLDYDKIIHSYQEYMRFVVKKPPTKKQFLLNIKEKMQDPYFSEDIGGLLRTGVEYDQDEAFEWITKEIVEKL